MLVCEFVRKCGSIASRTTRLSVLVVAKPETGTPVITNNWQCVADYLGETNPSEETKRTKVFELNNIEGKIEQLKIGTVEVYTPATISTIRVFDLNDGKLTFDSEETPEGKKEITIETE